MKLRDMMFLVIGGLLVISGMVLNTLLSGDAEAQEGVKDGRFRYVFCEGIMVEDSGIMIVDNEGKNRGSFGLDTNGDAVLSIFGDDEKTYVAYLGSNPNESNKEMNFYLASKSKTDKRVVGMSIDENGGRFQSLNKMGESVIRIGVHSDGGGLVDLRDKFGYKR